MRDKQLTDYETVRKHELATKSNCTVGGYNMDSFCPVGECMFYQLKLETADCDRVFLLGEFAAFTRRSCRPADLQPEMFTKETRERVASFGKGMVDLRTAEMLLPVGVTWDIDSGPLVLIDGNHRAIWQHLTYGSLADVPLYASVHPRMRDWLRSRSHPAFRL